MIAALLADADLAPVLAALPHARIVGGAVRDALANLPIADIDLATPDPPDRIMAALSRAGLRAVPTGLAHGTVTAISNGRPFEITTLRRDVATDGRHAEVAWTDDWRADAARRDFTVNAMSLDRAGTVHDHFGGADDLASGRVRFVGDPATRIAEDYLRVLRFFRFWARYGRQPPDAEARAAIAAAVRHLKQLSAERVWSELKRILQAPDPAPAIALMAELGVLAEVLPEGADPSRLAALTSAGAPPDPLLRLAALLTGDADTLAARLKLATAERDTLVALRHGPVPPLDGEGALWRRLLADEDASVLAARTWLAGGFGPAWNAARARLLATPRPTFPLEGRDALALGAAPGPAVGAALRATRAWWLNGGCRATDAELHARLKEELAGAPPPSPDPPSSVGLDDNMATRC
jgi:poly(A) polymerase/tRNA nucleotidyltransferase (CCA-adding enzyme)